MEDIDWDAALMHTSDVAIKMQLRLVHFNILHLIYYNSCHLYTMGRALNPHCPRCGDIEGSFFHTLLNCPRI